MSHEELMRLALEEAGQAAREGEVPVGAVLARQGQVIARAHNLREQRNDPTAHAELLCIRQAAELLHTRRLNGLTLYVTLEPCPMCAGAMVMAQLERCFFAARDQRQGCCESVLALTQDPAFYHRVPCVGGLMEEEAQTLLQDFFAKRRTGDKSIMNTEIKAIISDMDDTLLNDEGKLSDYTVATLRECIRRGIHVIPASGRTQTSVAPYAAQIGVDCPYIACNGAQLISSDHQVLEEETIPPETARAIVRYLQNEGFYVQVYRGEYFYYAKECGPSEKYRHSSGMKGQAVGDLLGFIDYPVPKILSVTDPSEVQRVMPLIKEAFRGQADFTMSKPFFIEGIAPNVSKGNALRRLAKRLDLTPENTMVFGDSLNDISMLNFSHNSVAMGNARAETKQAARFVCRSNQEDGVAHFVAEHVLGLPST